MPVFDATDNTYSLLNQSGCFIFNTEQPLSRQIAPPFEDHYGVVTIELWLEHANCYSLPNTICIVIKECRVGMFF